MYISKLFAVGSLAALVLLFATGCDRSPQAKEAKYLKRGQAQVAKNDYGRALLEFQNAAQVMPKDAEPYYRMALVYLKTNNLAMGIPALRKAVELNPKHAEAQLKLAELMTGSRNKELIEKAAGALQDLVAAS